MKAATKHLSDHNDFSLRGYLSDGPELEQDGAMCLMIRSYGIWI